jgi:sterol desaturase/sphingolipid hydroxylase (fatty acid hydroxylase superfamily)
LSSSAFPPFVVITAWVTLLYVVGLAIVLAATSIGRIGLENLALGLITVSFYAHVFFDKEYHVEGSRFQRFAWFRRKQELHFVHHRHANKNFGVIHFFWDRILGTYSPSNVA